MDVTRWPSGVDLVVPMPPGTQRILTAEALGFVADLTRRFTGPVEQLLQRRVQAQAKYDAGHWPDFSDETRAIREGEWSVATMPDDLRDRRVEITGPVDRKMIINALNSGANVFMADFEDATSPTWSNVLAGQVNLKDAVSRTIGHEDPQTGRVYRLHDRVATLVVRPRGWHLLEKHVLVDSRPVPAGLFDFGLYLFHNARSLVSKASGPYFYLPKLQGHLEARLWNDVFVWSQKALGLAPGSIRATVLIETLPAAFEMDEILYELRDHAAGLNCGRWDYIFSYIKTLGCSPAHVLPDRGQVTMEQPFMRAYTQLAIRTCHRRGASAIGGMAAQIPIKEDAHANDAAMAKVRHDKLREVRDGHDGTWVAHPGLVPLAREVFDAHMPTPNQIHRPRQDHDLTAHDLLTVPAGTRTLNGLRHNVDVGVRYLQAWLGGMGCVPIHHLMEDAATAEISRAQIWQWIRHAATLDDGTVVTRQLFQEVLSQQTKRILDDRGQDRRALGYLDEAMGLFDRLVTDEQLQAFLTLPAYERLLLIHDMPSEGESSHVQSDDVIERPVAP